MKRDNEQKIGDVIRQLFHSYRLDDKVALVRIKDLWGNILGAAAQRYTKEMYFNKGVLTVYITSAPFRQDLHFSRDTILQRINEELGEHVVKEIVIR